MRLKSAPSFIKRNPIGCSNSARGLSFWRTKSAARFARALLDFQPSTLLDGVFTTQWRHLQPAPAPSISKTRPVQQRDSYCQKCVRSDNIKIMPEAAKKSPAKKAAKPKAAPAHPPTATMVMAAVKGLKEAKGASLPAIKKYIAGNYKVII